MWIEYISCTQCLSSLALKALMLGALIIKGGSAFHSLITFTLKAFRQTLETALGFSSFNWKPQVVLEVAVVKNFVASTSTPCRST